MKERIETWKANPLCLSCGKPEKVEGACLYLGECWTCRNVKRPPKPHDQWMTDSMKEEKRQIAWENGLKTKDGETRGGFDMEPPYGF